MEFTSEKELYNFLKPVFLVRKRIDNYYKYNISSRDIWLYLKNNKWKDSINLSLYEIVNDILNIDYYLVGGSYE